MQGFRIVRLFFRVGSWRVPEALLQGVEFGACSGSKEPEVAYFHKATRQGMLQEMMNEFFGGEGSSLGLSVFGIAVGESNLRALQRTRGESQQTTIRDGDAIDVGSQVLQSSIPVPDGFGMDDPLLTPNVSRQKFKKRCLAQFFLESSPKKFGKSFYR